ncbi:MAG TPA: hypothetical protein GX497_03195 [Bacillus bacterium]|nr:hypothetical protein [Bacillus sp. (in: firmicutes)]
MNNQNLLGIQKVLRDNSVLISFSGKLSQGIIEELGEAVKKYLETEDVPKKEIFNIFSIFIEQTQNIKNYCYSKAKCNGYEHIAASSIITIGKTEKGSFICSGNLLCKDDIRKVTDKIDRLIVMDKEELKKTYKETLKLDVDMDSVGAGLGLIDMARKASCPLEYSITNVDEQFSFFTLKAVV